MKTMLVCLTILFLLEACAFQFEVETPRSILEKQYIGEIESFEDPLIALDVKDVNQLSSKFASDSSATSKAKNIHEFRRIFNAPDIETLLDEQILGETADGKLEKLPPDLGLVSKASKEQTLFAELLVNEENKDRAQIFQLKTSQNQEEAENRAKLFGMERYEAIKMGTWFKNSAGVWIQKK